MRGSTAKVVILADGGFCVLLGIIELKKWGVFVAALIKKHHFRPKYIPGDKIIEHFENKEVGDVDALPGVLDKQCALLSMHLCNLFSKPLEMPCHSPSMYCNC